MRRSSIIVAVLAVVTRTAAAQVPPDPGSGAPPPPEPAPPPPVDASPVVESNPPPPPVATTAVVPSPEVEPAPTSHAFASAKVGGIAPFDGLSPFVSFGLEAGFVLPAADHRLAIVLDVDYTQPTKTGSEIDTRVMGGTYTWKLTEQELAIMPALIYRMTGMSPVIPYGGIGPRLLLARSTVQDNGAPTIMATHEQSTRIGVGVPLGAELPLGPGRAIGELLFQYGTLNHVATGDANTGAISLSVGYRMLF